MSLPKSLAAVAMEAGVSIGTASQVLNRDDPRYSLATRDRVRASALKLGYSAHANIDARRLVARRTGQPTPLRNIGFFWHTPEGSPMRNPFFQLFMDGAMDACRERGQILSLLSLGDTCDKDYPLLRQVDGLVALIAGHPAVEVAHRLQKPVVSIFQEDPRFSNLGIDERQALGLAFDGLWAAGHRRIGYVGNNLDGGTAQRRYEAYCHWMRKAGAKVDPRLTALAINLTSYRLEGARLFKQIWERTGARERPTGILAYNDSMALGVIDAACELGLRVPEDLSVVGLDGTLEGTTVRSTLTTVDIGLEGFGRKAVELIESAARTGHWKAERVNMPVSLRSGGTVAAVRAEPAFVQKLRRGRRISALRPT
jgi:DNA-binding LacI/PurR family transcriptional regulator